MTAAAHLNLKAQTLFAVSVGAYRPLAVSDRVDFVLLLPDFNG